MGTQYLVRFDDICPTMNWSIWEQVEDLLRAARVKPILAVVPDNQDPNLKVSESNLQFWDRVRDWQNRGWAIGCHGYQHLPVTRNGGILRINTWGELSGLSFEEQRLRLHNAWKIFDSQGVRPDLWIAPAHSFDSITLRVLLDLGVQSLSDGFSLFPYEDSAGMTWVPQQLWKFRKMPFGIWTICLHLNRWNLGDVERFRSDLRKFEAALTDWQSIISLYPHRKRSLLDVMFSRTYPTALRVLGHAPRLVKTLLR